MNSKGMLVLFVVGALAVGACRNTYNGVKADTHNAVQKTGHGVEKTGEKIENAGK
jgi:predicted small secreted protein